MNNIILPSPPLNQEAGFLPLGMLNQSSDPSQTLALHSGPGLLLSSYHMTRFPSTSVLSSSRPERTMESPSSLLPAPALSQAILSSIFTVHCCVCPSPPREPSKNMSSLAAHAQNTGHGAVLTTLCGPSSTGWKVLGVLSRSGGPGTATHGRPSSP